MPLRERLRSRPKAVTDEVGARLELRRLFRMFKGEMVREAIRELVKEVKQEISIQIKTVRGDDGYTPVKGVDYQDGAPGKDADEEAIFQRVMAQLPQPKDGQDADEEKITESVIKRLKEDKEAITIDDVKGLKDVLKAIENVARKEKGGGGGGMGNFAYKSFTGDDSTTSFTLDYNVASGGTAILLLMNGQGLEYSTHFTVSGKTISTTFTPTSNDTLWAWYIRT